MYFTLKKNPTTWKTNWGKSINDSTFRVQETLDDIGVQNILGGVSIMAQQ